MLDITKVESLKKLKGLYKTNIKKIRKLELQISKERLFYIDYYMDQVLNTLDSESIRKRYTYMNYILKEWDLIDDKVQNLNLLMLETYEVIEFLDSMTFLCFEDDEMGQQIDIVQHKTNSEWMLMISNLISKKRNKKYSCKYIIDDKKLTCTFFIVPDDFDIATISKSDLEFFNLFVLKNNIPDEFILYNQINLESENIMTFINEKIIFFELISYPREIREDMLEILFQELKQLCNNKKK